MTTIRNLIESWKYGDTLRFHPRGDTEATAEAMFIAWDELPRLGVPVRPILMILWDTVAPDIVGHAQAISIQSPDWVRVSDE